MKYRIHEIDRDPVRVTITDREHLLAVLGPIMLEALEESGSLSQGKTIYEAISEPRVIDQGLFTNEPLIAKAREYARPVFPIMGKVADTATPHEIFAVVERNYEGGLAQFVNDNPTPTPARSFRKHCASGIPSPSTHE